MTKRHIEERHQRLAAALEQIAVALLDDVDASFDLILGEAVTGLAGAIHVEERAANQWSLTLVAPSRMYGMWQSAQETPLRACTP